MSEEYLWGDNEIEGDDDLWREAVDKPRGAEVTDAAISQAFYRERQGLGSKVYTEPEGKGIDEPE